MKTLWILLGILNLFHGPAWSRRTTDNPSWNKGQQKMSSTILGNWSTLTGEPTILVAHRGEKVLMPEHTLGSYEFASVEGADFVEPDLVLTKDGFLVCFHDLTLKVGTDVASRPEFAHLKTNFTGIIDFENITILNDWFIKDFTLEELKTLTIVQKDVGIRPQMFNQLFHIPAFQEYLDVVHHNAFKLNKAIGIIPELKHPRFHNDLHTPNYMEDTFLTILSEYGYPLTPTATPNCSSRMDQNATILCGHLVIQSFESNCLKYLTTITSVEKMMLLNDKQLPLLTYEGLQSVSEYAAFYSLWKELLYTGILAQIENEGIVYNETLIAEMGGFIPPQSIVPEAHNLGLKVGIYTIYDSREPSFRGCSVKCEPENKELELFYYFDMGVDSMFVENVPEAREIRMKYQYEVVQSVGDLAPKKNSSVRVEHNLMIIISIYSLTVNIMKYVIS